MTIDEFWRCTPRLLLIAFRAYRRRRAWAAWHAGAPGIFKDVTFDQLIGRAPARAAPAQQTPEQMRAVMGAFVKRWNRQFERD